MDHSRPSLRLDPDAGGELLNTALAKREDLSKGQKKQSYREHVTAVYDAWCGLVHRASRPDRSYRLTPRRDESSDSSSPACSRSPCMMLGS